MLSVWSKASSSGPWSKRLRLALEESGEPDRVELTAAIEEVLELVDPIVRLERLKPKVYRLHLSGTSLRSIILKRLEPASAQRTRLVAERWLPALGLAPICARLLGVAAPRGGGSIWHLYEDVGDETLAAHPEGERVAAVVDVVAQLHTRGAEHPLLVEVRHYGRDFGIGYFTANVLDAIRGLEALSPGTLPGDVWDARARLLDRLTQLMDDGARRGQCLRDVGGPETLLHGDLWSTNVFVSAASSNGARARLVDWDRVGVGPLYYDLSTLLYRFPSDERPGIVARYQQAVEPMGWHLPDLDDVNLLCDTAEQARYANCVAWTVVAWLQDQARWAPAQLLEIERWFDALEPAVPVIV